ncbi:MAG TPA: hypothetical protein VHD87_10910 [Acidimicrobiales bacterium]|nr:hypothetical protein [Acidimicrobiales bacterium]
MPYAFGGAVALAYCVYEARGTHDLDINVFVPVSAVDAVIAALPREVVVSDTDRGILERDGQVRLHWGDMPVDIFLSTDPFHDDALAHVRPVPFVEGVTIPVLGCKHLAVFKSFFARGKDFVDIGHMVEANSIDDVEVRAIVAGFLGEESREVAALDRAIEEARQAPDDPMGGRFSPRSAQPRE